MSTGVNLPCICIYNPQTDTFVPSNDLLLGIDDKNENLQVVYQLDTGRKLFFYKHSFKSDYINYVQNRYNLSDKGLVNLMNDMNKKSSTFVVVDKVR